VKPRSRLHPAIFRLFTPGYGISVFLGSFPSIIAA